MRVEGSDVLGCFVPSIRIMEVHRDDCLAMSLLVVSDVCVDSGVIVENDE